MKNYTKATFLLLLSLIFLISNVSAVHNETTVVSASVITKPLLGLLVPLGIETFVSAVDAVFLYNLISITILLFIAAMSGARSEAAFCMIVPIFAGIFEYFGWLRATSPVTHLPSTTAQMSLIALTVIMFILGVMMYMNDQNKQNYGSVGPGSKLQNIAVYLILFNVSLTLVTGFSVFPMMPAQPLRGTCAAGFTCDTQGNFEFTTTSNSFKQASGVTTTVIDAAGIFISALGALALTGLSMLVGIFWVPALLNSIVSGPYPWLVATGEWTAFTLIIEALVLLIYFFGARGWISNAPGDAL